MEVGEEHDEAHRDVCVLDAEVDDVDGGHVGDAEAAVHHHQLVQEGAGLLYCFKKVHPKVRNHGEGPY